MIFDIISQPEMKYHVQVRLAKRAKEIYESSKVDEKRQILDFLFSNLEMKGEKSDGGGGIRTHGTGLAHTRFPSVLLRPLGHSSIGKEVEHNELKILLQQTNMANKHS